jgi:hypothetical protein
MTSRTKMLFLIAVLVFPSFGRPQGKRNVTMSGFVSDQSRHPVEGARITVAGSKALSDATTDTGGSFILTFGPDAAEGSAVFIQVEKSGYRPYSQWVPISSSVPVKVSLMAVKAMPSGGSSPQTSPSQPKTSKPVEEDGPFTWTLSLVFPQTNSEPNTASGAHSLGLFVPDRDIRVTRIVASFAGGSAVVTPHGGEPCSVPPYFYLSSGPNRGVMNAAYKLALPNGAVPTGYFGVDSGPISVNFPAGAEVTASYQLGFDATRICFNITNSGEGILVWTANTSGVVPDNFTVQYYAKRSTHPVK